jgi:hypothetical protein
VASTAGPTAWGNEIAANSIFDNGGLRIDLADAFRGGPDGITPNDPEDLDQGPNGFRNAPVLEAGYQRGQPVRGTVVFSGPFPDYRDYVRVDLYVSPSADPSSHGEGRRYLGGIPIHPDTHGVARLESYSENYLLFLPEVGEYLTATATDQDGNTCEFSEAVLIGPAAGAAVAHRSVRASGHLSQTGALLQVRSPKIGCTPQYHYTTNLSPPVVWNYLGLPTNAPNGTQVFQFSPGPTNIVIRSVTF